MLTPFNSWDSYFKFANAVRYKSRYLHDDVVVDFLKALSECTEKRIEIISVNKPLWRAQLGNDWREVSHEGVKEAVPFSLARMKPLRHSAHEGRVNPKGIPCLYTANDIPTAIAEIRPWHGARVSVAQLKTVKELRIVNCSDGQQGNMDFCIYEPPPEEREEIVWRDIGRAFSKPVTLDPGIAEYVPTQILSEHFRHLGYDGVRYKSKLGSGYNIAFFDIDVLDIVDVRLYPVKAIKYEIGEMEHAYAVRHQQTEP